MNTTATAFHEANRASEVLSKIGSGATDADFARAIHQAVDRVMATEKPAKVLIEVVITPDKQLGCLRLRAEVSAKLPKLPAPASQMHVGPQGQLLTQHDWMFGGGRDEAPLQAKPVAEPVAAAASSGRFQVAAVPTPGPVASAPTPKPVAGKDQAAGEKA